MARKKRKVKKEEEMNEAWLLPYSDLMTLLLALFISLFAISQTDQKKVSQLAQAFSAAFNMGGPSFFNNAGPNAGRRAEMMSTEDKGNAAYIAENQKLQEVQKQMEDYIEQNGLQDQISTQMSEDGLMVSIREKALFPSGSAELTPQAQGIAGAVANLLASINEQVVISGHTDNMPIHNAQYPTNWDLSAARALNVMKYLLSISNMDPQRFSAVGYGEYRPVADNSTEEGRTKNRRVEILIARSYRYQANNGDSSGGDSTPSADSAIQGTTMQGSMTRIQQPKQPETPAKPLQTH